ncbi:TPA: hypothetical protein N0F65_007619 [Lagenidium giganteum]|uniref:Uncharacterized protein n=1 Tax=Lagenidium giganteum TaxID=4803 RepID=A0AAV2Z9L4_9STRA|nr:TPA: hypothetical protein N0F65_007619 [Lagenidium giganteum]
MASNEREHELERQLAEQCHAVEELSDALAAQKLLNEKQTAELNAKELLLLRKNDRIDELLEQLKDRNTEIDRRQLAAESLRERIESLQTEVHDLHEQLEREEEDFAMLRAALDAKEELLKKKQEELVQAREVEAKLCKDVDHFQTIIRRLEKTVDDLHPETADACLSPRSFTENQLIQLRDEAIQAKTKEVWLLMGQTDQLRAQLDELEVELEKLQTSYVSRENDVARRDRKIEKLESELESLKAARQQAEGREKTIEIATTQNAKLLQALQAQEAANEELELLSQRLQVECDALRKQQRQYLEKSAVNEVEVMQKTKEVEEKSSAVSLLQSKLSRERKELQQELTDLRLKFQIETEKIQGELVMRRNKQYELTWKLQESERKLHEANDGLEQTTEQLLATRCRMEEAEHVLNDALRWKASLEQQLAQQQRDGSTVIAEKETVALQAQKEAEALRQQLRELKASLLKNLDQDKQKDLHVRDLKRVIESREQLVNEQKERISRLVQEANRESKLRAELEGKCATTREQLERVRQQMDSVVKDCTESVRKAEEKTKLQLEKFTHLEREYTKEQLGKSKLTIKLADALRCCTTNDKAWPTTLDLKELWLADHDLAPILSTLEVCPDQTIRIDLRANRITQDGMRLMLHFFKKLTRAPTIREFDLRNNCVSLDGIRTLASGLETIIETSSSPWLHSVVVKYNGRIECFAHDNPLAMSPQKGRISNEWDGQPKASHVPPAPLLVVDVTNNFDADTLVAQMRKLHRRKPRPEIASTSNNRPDQPTARGMPLMVIISLPTSFRYN